MTFHQKLENGSFSTINALAYVPENKMPKKEGSDSFNQDFIYKVSKYLKKLKRRKSDKRIKKLKNFIKTIDSEKRVRVQGVSKGILWV